MDMTGRNSARSGRHRSSSGRLVSLWGALIGALLGFSVGAISYVLITPTLEASAGWVRELQGLSWNLVPGLTILGAVVGLVIGRALRRRARGRI